MGTKRRDREVTYRRGDSANGSSANRGAAGRRRLLRALGGAGGAGAISALLAPGWVRPIVQAVVLPAHAQLSPGSLPSCIVTVQYGAPGFGAGISSACTSYSDSSTTILPTLTTFDSASALAGTFTTMLAGAGNAGFTVSAPTGGAGAGFDLTVSCCADSGNFGSAVFPGSAYGEDVALVVADDGTCTINP